MVSLEQLKSDKQLLDYIESRRSENAAASDDAVSKEASTVQPAAWTASSTTVQQRSLPQQSTEATSRSKNSEQTVTTLANGKRPHLGLPLAQLERHDAISCHATGKRSCCASDDLIRMYVKFPLSGDRLAFWVHRELMIGGALPKTQSNRFTDVYGERDERKQPANDTAAEYEYLMQLMTEDSLKLRVQKLTGIPVEHQKLWYNKTMLGNPISSLRRAGIGHGSEVMIRCKTRVARKSMFGDRGVPALEGTKMDGMGEQLLQGAAPAVGYRWYNKSGDSVVRERTLASESEDRLYLDRVSNTSERSSNARKSQESHKRDSIDTAGGHGDGSVRTITKDYDIDCNLLHKRISQIPKTDAIYVNQSSVRYSSVRGSMLGHSQYIGARDSTATTGRDSAAARESAMARESAIARLSAGDRETTQEDGTVTSGTFEQVVSRLSQKDKDILRQQFNAELKRAEQSSPLEDESYLSKGGPLQQYYYYSDTGAADAGNMTEGAETERMVVSVCKSKEKHYMILLQGVFFCFKVSFSTTTPKKSTAYFLIRFSKSRRIRNFNHSPFILQERTEDVDASPSRVQAGRSSVQQDYAHYYDEGALGDEENEATEPLSRSRARISTGAAGVGPYSARSEEPREQPTDTVGAAVSGIIGRLSSYFSPSKKRGSYGTTQEGRVSSSAVEAEESFQGVAPAAGPSSVVEIEGDDALAQYVRNSSSAGAQPEAAAAEPAGPQGAAARTSGQRASWTVGSYRGMTQGTTMTQRSSRTRSSMTNHTTPFLIMPKMQFHGGPKLFDPANKLTYDSPLYFDNFSDHHSFRDGGHGDAFARVRERVLGTLP
ncbi:unnamed protein product [Amoebophrya sp. A25]|nr:unnamed protein product [Amoebophrya sp. A25]|eukprot:GSA25T00021868001.1